MTPLYCYLQIEADSLCFWQLPADHNLDACNSLTGGAAATGRRWSAGRSGSSTSNKAFPCSFCEKSFTSSSHRNRHMQIHTGQFTFYCHECNRGFNDRGYYTAHMNRHEGRSFPCQFCSKRYSTERLMRTHMRTAHSKDY